VRGGVVTLGNFDGVHLGHQTLLAAMKTLAYRVDCGTHVVSFAPHPRDYFAAQGFGSPVLSIGSVRERLERLRDCGVQHAHLLRFNHTMATLSPQAFVERVLVKGCNARHVIVGHDVRFGHQRTGDLVLLKTLGQAHGFEVHTVDDFIDQSLQRISSSAIRAALQAGQIDQASALLGRPMSMAGKVIHGRKIGRSLGCPTLNLVPNMAHPALKGICVVAIEGLPSQPIVCYGVASLGLRPTVENTTRYSLEVHAFDWSGNAYGHRVRIRFLHKLRDEAAYVDLPTLQIAIEQDMRDARAWLEQHRG
jgi:riboflavin kinase/FMN adenylyltransferase